MSKSRYVAVSALLNGAELRTAKCEGVDYIVAPVVAMIGDSVVWPVNADMPEYVPASVLSLAPEQWNNRPVCMSHPKVDGVYVSANTPEILESWSYGRTFNAYFDSSDNKLKMEAWMSESKAKKLGDDAQRVLERLRGGEMVEISIGAFITAEKLDSVGVTSDGQEYGSIWLSVASDHLATLDEHSTGACSVEMGCGLLRVSASKLSASILSQARTPTYTGTETSSWSTPSFADYVKYLHEGATGTGPKSVKECSSDLKRKISEHSLLGDPSANNIRELALFACVNPANGNLNEKALRAIIGGRGTSADIDDKAKKSAQEIATRLLNSEFGISDMESRTDDMNVNDDRGKGKSNKPSALTRMLNAIKDAMSGNQLRTRLYNALRDIEPHIAYVEDEDQSTGIVVYYTYEYENYNYRDICWQRTFSLSANNNVTINDDRKRVERVSRYEVIEDDGENDNNGITATEGKPSCGCGKANKETTEGESTMAIDEKDLEAIGRVVGEALTKVMQEKDSKPVEAKAEDTASDGDSSVAPASPMTPDDLLSSPHVTEEAKALIRAERERENAKRTKLIDGIKAASKFTEDKLKLMDTPTLETLAESVKVEIPSAVADFSGKGVVVSASASNRKLPDPWGLEKKAAAG